MSRETRKINLRKLQVPVAANSRKLRSAARPATIIGPISDYFSTPNKVDSELAASLAATSPQQDGLSDQPKSTPMAQIDNRFPIKSINTDDIVQLPGEQPVNNIHPKTAVPKKDSRNKRTKLTAFLYRSKQDQPGPPLDDFETPQKEIKRAPKIKPAATRKTSKSRSKRQQNIKSAFFRNEQLFSEITAQHCLADNINPDDLQLALAISKSETETSRALCANLDEDVVELVANRTSDAKENVVEDSIRNKLRKYGFRTAAREDYNTFAAACLPSGVCGSGRSKRKWANKFTALTLRNPEVQAKKANAKVEVFLATQCKTRPLIAADNELTPYSPISRTVRQSTAPAAAYIFRNSEDMCTATNLANYFIEDLFEVTYLKAGHLLKNWSAIQGRDLSPSLRTTEKQLAEQKLCRAYAQLEQYFGERRVVNFDSAEANMPGTSTATETAQPRNTINGIKIAEHTENVADLSSFNTIAKAASVRGTSTEPGDEVVPDMLPSKQHSSGDNLNLLAQVNSLNKSARKSVSPATSPCKPPPDKKLKLDNSDRSAQLSPLHQSTTSSISVYTTQCTRATSPDIFADSFTEMETEDGEIVTAAQKGSWSADNVEGIITYELYSSDEVKIGVVAKPDNESSTEAAVSDRNIPTVLVDVTQEEQLDHEELDREMCLFAEYSPHSSFNKSLGGHSQHPKHQINNIDINLCGSKERLEQDNAILKEITQQTDHNCSYMQNSLSNSSLTEDIVISKSVGSKDLAAFENKKQLNVRSISLSQMQEPRWSGCTAMNAKRISLSSTKQNTSLNANRISLSPTKQNPSLNAKRISLSPTKQKPSLNANRISLSPTKQNPSLNAEIQTNLNDTLFVCDNMEFHNSQTPSRNATFSLNASVPVHRTIPHLESKTSNANIDLSLSDDDGDDAVNKEDDDDDDDFAIFMLSNDEINYSIMAADKISTTENSDFEEEDFSSGCLSISSPAHSITNEAVSASDSDLFPPITEPVAAPVPAQKSESDAHEFSFLDLIDEEKSFCSSIMPHPLTRHGTASTISFDDDVEPVLGEFLTTPNKRVGYGRYSPTSSVHSDTDLYKERAAFGILESQSDLFTQSPNKTPAKVAQYSAFEGGNDGDDILAEFSFLSSPSENAAHMKRYSSSNTQKFNELLKAVVQHSPEPPKTDDDEFDEFDKLVYGSPTFKNVKDAPNVPAGLQQLLTAEISLEEHTAEVDEQPSKAATTDLLEEIEVNGNIYTVRTSHSPKPEFTKQTEAELLKQLYGYGIKPLKRKQAVLMLEFIYNQTHPTMTEAADCDDVPLEEACIVREPAVSQDSSAKTCKKLQLQDCFGDVLLRYAQERSPELVDETECYVFQLNISKKMWRPLLPLHIAWYNAVCGNSALHESVLMYEPIDLEELYLFFKGLGYRYDPKELQTFLDRRCISFRYDLTPAVYNRHERKSQNKISAT